MKTKSLAFCAILSAVICVMAPLSIPLGAIPVSLATFAIYLISCTAEKKYSVTAVAVYLLLGSFGVPVFSGFTGGFQKFASATGGYLAGYLPMALIIAVLVDKYEDKKIIYPLSMIFGTVVLYSLGTAWFMINTKVGIASALTACVLPFVPVDCAKIAVASILGMNLRKRLKKFFNNGY